MIHGVNIRALFILLSLFFAAPIFASVAGASSVSVYRLQVRVVTGAVELSAGSVAELRIYETGKPVLRLPLGARRGLAARFYTLDPVDID